MAHGVASGIEHAQGMHENSRARHGGRLNREDKLEVSGGEIGLCAARDKEVAVRNGQAVREHEAVTAGGDDIVVESRDVQWNGIAALQIAAGPYDIRIALGVRRTDK